MNFGLDRVWCCGWLRWVIHSELAASGEVSSRSHRDPELLFTVSCLLPDSFPSLAISVQLRTPINPSSFCPPASPSQSTSSCPEFPKHLLHVLVSAALFCVARDIRNPEMATVQKSIDKSKLSQASAYPINYANGNSPDRAVSTINQRLVSIQDLSAWLKGPSGEQNQVLVQGFITALETNVVKYI